MYYCDFKDINDNDIRLEIYTYIDGIGVVPVSTEIQLASPDAITIEYAADSIFLPLKKSGATINIVNDDLMIDLFTGELLTPYIKIYRNNSLFWYGFVTPNLYTQPYEYAYDNLSLECIDTLSTLENVDYDFLHDEQSSTFLEIICHILDKVDPNYVINNIYVSKSLSYNNDSEILDVLRIYEKNFYDEIDEPLKCDQVLEELMKFLGFTMCQYKDSYYIIDISDTQSSSFVRYQRSQGVSSTVSLSDLSIKDLGNIGLSRTATNITLDGVYNKVTIIASTVEVESPIEETDDDSYGASLFGDLVNQNADSDHVETINLWIDEDANIDAGLDNAWSLEETSGHTHYVLENSWWRSQSAWQTLTPSFYSTGSTHTSNFSGEFTFSKATERSRIANVNQWHWQTGATWLKNMSYKASEIPSSWNFTPVLTMAAGDGGRGWSFEPYVLKTEREITAYTGGYLVINIDFVRSSWPFVCNGLPETSFKYNADDYIIFPAKLSIGNHYWNGSAWKTYTDDFLAKINAGYFDYPIWCEDISFYGGTYYNWPGNIYKVWNSNYHDWDYVTLTEYNNFSGTKEIQEVWHTKDAFGTNTTNVRTFYIKKNGANVQVSEDYRNQYMSDRFWIGRKFEQDDKRDGTHYKLNNTSTYRLNLNNPTEGLAIAIPEDQTFSGTFRFQMSAPRSDISSLMPGGIIRNILSGYAGNYYHIHSLYVKYSQADDENSIFDTDNGNKDIKYTNVINEDYICSLDDIELRVNTYTDSIQSYSYVLANSNNGIEYIDKLDYNNTNKQQEEHLIDKYVNHYQDSKIMYETVINNMDITPFSRMHSDVLNKDLQMISAVYNMSDDNVQIKSTEV